MDQDAVRNTSYSVISKLLKKIFGLLVLNFFSFTSFRFALTVQFVILCLRQDANASYSAEERNCEQ